MQSRSIMIIEDDRDIRETLKEALTMMGYETVTASNGQEALQTLKTIKNPRLILLDLMMPIMNGWQFRAKQQEDPDLSKIPTVVISADANAFKKAEGLGVSACLKKPVELDDLLNLADRYCSA